ncbi:TetR/AcrR family transcriptional regulator [Clostridium sp. SHJSY1]|uniref:TetR/AcrR family transcriptional regulator n=1 Tax=Clostridium sp. SHJSY1 TaxID=2942483 RepID=UPI00287652C0|nr:TetR/AcrR family transcriptional regulator [Clostridium sp. SHJSY1]MDS0527655.1 TetR/AcrR family transcriptional regulator [Clostridium sp. SHJSY1]
MRRKNIDELFIRDCVAEALAQLAKEKSYNEISVVDICKRAGIGRTTFYRYFNNSDGKKDVVFYKISRAWGIYSENHPESIKTNLSQALMNYLYEEKEQFIWLYKNGLTDIIFEIFYVSTVMDPRKQAQNLYADAFLAGGLFGVVYQWVKDGFREKPESIIKQLSKGSF